MITLNMPSYNFLIFISFASMVFGYLLYVVFGQITVRKLRKKLETKEHLGITFISGGDIFNVATIFSYPKFFLKLLERGQKRSGNSNLIANKKILFEHTNLFDRILGRTVFWLINLSVLSFFIFGTLDHLTS